MFEIIINQFMPMGIINLIVIEILESRDIVKTAKDGPESVFHEMILY